MILVTRQRRFAAHTVLELKKIGHDAIILPMLHMRYIYKEIIDDNYDVVLFTSKNAVYATVHLDWIKKKKIYAVGAKTAKLLHNLRCGDVVFCDEFKQNSHELANLVLENVPVHARIIYMSGLETSCAVDQALIGYGYDVVREIVYESLMVQHLSEQAVSSINDLVTTVLFYSPRTALAFTSLAKKYQLHTCNKKAICISHNTAAKLDPQCWGEISIAAYSHEGAIFQCI